MEAYIPDADDRKQAVTEFFANSGQQFLPILELLIDAKEQLHDFTHAVGVAAIEGLLELSATQLAGPPHPGKATPPTQTAEGAVRRHGHQKGVRMFPVKASNHAAEALGDPAALMWQTASTAPSNGDLPPDSAISTCYASLPALPARPARSPCMPPFKTEAS